MALKLTVDSVHGFTAIDALHRVEHLSIAGRDKISFHLRSYTAFDKPFFAENIYEADYDLYGENPVKQAYLYVKTLPEYEGAEDV